MLIRGNVCSGEKIFNLCSIEARSFDEAALRYIAANDRQGVADPNSTA
ncbi:MAG: hypothetical protein G8D61_14265 [gamma proteobacterium symbiont of Ctena orbiculata]